MRDVVVNIKKLGGVTKTWLLSLLADNAKRSIASLLLSTSIISLTVPAANAQTQDQSSIGVFQFVATTIDVVGLEDDVSYIVRNELRKTPNLLVINQRELEVTLTRNDIEQKFSAQEAVKAATILNLNYVIVGQVSREGQQIVANVEVVSPIAGESVGDLRFTFNNQAQIALQATYIGESLAEVIAEHKISAQNTANNIGVDWLESISAEYAGGLVSLSWTTTDPNVSFLGFNVYRAVAEQGPFSYVASEAELSAKDNPGNDAATYYYQLSMINDEGEELRSEKLATVTVEAVVQSNLQAPTIVDTTERVNGIALAFFPSAENVGKQIIGYELVRRSGGEDWQVVDTYSLPSNRTGKQSNSSSQASIEKLSLADKKPDTINGEVFYGVRAVSALEKGQITESIAYTPASAPSLELISNKTLREITLGWQAASSGFGYRVYRKLDNQEDWLLLAELKGLEVITYTDTDISEEEKAFEYAVSVFDDFGETRRSVPLIAKSKAALSAPEQVKGTSGLARKATINWQVNPDPDVAGYSIFRAPYSADKELTLTRIGEVNDPSVTEFTDESQLLDGTEYYYSVASINKYNNSGPASKAVLVTTKMPPEGLVDFTATLASSAVDLTWSLPPEQTLADIQNVQLERSFDGINYEKIALVEPSQNTYNDKSIIAGSGVKYRAFTTDLDGLVSQPALSEEVAITFPLVLSVAQDALLRKISLAWQHASSPAIVKVYRGTDQQNLKLVAELSEQLESTFIDEKDLVDDQQYFVKIEAWLAGNKLAESNIVTSTTKDIPAPTNLIAQSDLPQKIELSWEPVNDDSITQYVIFRRSLSKANSQLVSIAQINDKSTTNYTDTMLENTDGTLSDDSIKHGNEYEYAIASKNVFDATGFIGNTVIGASKKLPVSPSNINVESDNSAIALSWQVGNEIDLEQVIIERKWSFETSWSELAKVSVSSTKFSDTDLYPYASPEYRLTTTDSDGLRSLPALVSGIDNINDVTLSVLQEKLLRKIQVGWSETRDNINVIVQRRKIGGSWQKLATVDAAAASYTDTQGLVDQTEYEYQLLLQTKSPANVDLGSSNVVAAATKNLPAAPKLDATSGLVKQVSLSWQQASDPDVGGYNLYKIDSKGTLDKVDTFKRNETAYLDEGSFFSKLEDGTDYQYKIASFNIYNVEGVHGELMTATTKRLPDIPADISAALSGGASASSITVNWSANTNPDIANYEVYRGSSCTRVSKIGSVSSSNPMVYIDNDTKDGRSYCYKVKAIDTTKLESALSLGVQVTTPEAQQ